MRRFPILQFGAALLFCLTATACVPRDATLISPEACPLVPGEKIVAEYIPGEGRTGIVGRVIMKEGGGPLAGASVYAYPDVVSNLLGPSQFISAPTGEDGSYELEARPGTYYVVARKRGGGEQTGPLSPGDQYSEHQRLVTVVVEGKFSVVDLEVAPMRAPMFFKKGVVDQGTDTGIRGTLLDGEGKPVAGGFAMAYTDQEVRRLPDFVSTLTDSAGRFTLYLPEGGTYYLAARTGAWDMPLPGEAYGRLLGGVTVEGGSFVEGVRIEMGPFTAPYKEGKSRRPF